MNIYKVINNDIANGEGIRVSVFVSGCIRNCPGCFSPFTHDYNAGTPATKECWKEIFDMVDKEYISGISFLGGDPLAPGNDRGMYPILQQFKERFPNKTVWLYTGCTWENCRHFALLDYVDVLVDGPYDRSQECSGLRFKGSANQRIIDVKKTKETGEIVLWED